MALVQPNSKIPWIEKLKSAKKAGLLQNGIDLKRNQLNNFKSAFFFCMIRPKKSSLYIRRSFRNG